MTPEDPPRCHFCGTFDVLFSVGIALGMSGNDYSFCEACLKSNSAYKFWYNFLKTKGYEFPDETED